MDHFNHPHIILMQAGFESAAGWLAAAPGAASLDNDAKLEVRVAQTHLLNDKIYGIYKTVTEGPVP